MIFERFFNTLSALLDTLITTPADGQVLQYNGSAGKWINVDPTDANALPLTGGTLSGQLSGPGGNTFDDGGGNSAVKTSLTIGDGQTVDEPAMNLLSIYGMSSIEADLFGNLSIVSGSGSVDFSGAAVTAGSFSGDGSNLYNLPAPSGDGSGLYNLQAADLVGALPAISGANLTNIPAPSATSITTGTLANARTTAVTSSTANTIALRDGSGNLNAVVFNGSAGSAVLAAPHISGVPIAMYTTSLTNQSASQVNVQTLNPGGAAYGFCRVSFNVVITQAATTSSTIGPFSVNYNDASTGNNVTLSGVTTSTANTTSTCIAGTLLINFGGFAFLQFSLTYASAGATPMKYAICVHVERLA